MRKLLIALVFVVLLFPSFAFGETVKFKDLVERDGLYYKKFSNVPFTGKTTGKLQGSFRNGKKHGLGVEYHDNGQLSSEGAFKNDKLDGPWVRYYKDGQLLTKGTYKNGKDDGPWVFYDADGTVSKWFTGIYKNGVLIP